MARKTTLLDPKKQAAQANSNQSYAHQSKQEDHIHRLITLFTSIFLTTMLTLLGNPDRSFHLSQQPNSQEANKFKNTIAEFQGHKGLLNTKNGWLLSQTIRHIEGNHPKSQRVGKYHCQGNGEVL